MTFFFTAAEKCFVMVSPMEVSLLTTPGIVSTIVDASSTFPEVPKDVVDIDAQLDKTAPYIYSREVVQYWRVRTLIFFFK